MDDYPKQIKSFYPPVCIYGEYSKHWYIIADGNWIPVGRKYDWNELETIWIRTTPKAKPTEPTQKEVEYEVEGSRGNVYLVKHIGNFWSCTCPAHGFSRGRDCKHIKQIKSSKVST